MAELLPELYYILSKDAKQTLTAKKLPRPTIAQTRTTEKVMTPMTIAELKTAVISWKVQSPKRNPQQKTATKKPRWNSSTKLEKIKSHTSEGQLKHHSVRKVLNFQSTPKPVSNVRPTLISSETPKFPKPELREKKSLHLQAKSSVGISEICNIPPTLGIPLQPSNKENRPYQANNINRKKIATPKNLIQKKFKESFPDKPISNLSFKSNGDDSFLLKEKEIHDIEEKTRALEEESTLENIAEVSPPVSAPWHGMAITPVIQKDHTTIIL